MYIIYKQEEQLRITKAVESKKLKALKSKKYNPKSKIKTTSEIFKVVWGPVETFLSTLWSPLPVNITTKESISNAELKTQRNTINKIMVGKYCFYLVIMNHKFVIRYIYIEETFLLMIFFL